jgi:protein arginine N-methyltransferase 1
MLDSVLVARNKFLKEDGSLYPSHARILMAPIKTQLTETREAELQRATSEWGAFNQDMMAYYDVNLSAVNDDFAAEQREYCIQTAQWTDVHPGQLLGQASVLKEYDLKTVTLEEIAAPMHTAFEMSMARPGPVSGWVGFFDTAFKGSPQNPTQTEVWLSTAPDATGATHWGQMTFQVSPPIQANAGDVIKCTLEMHRRKENQRLMSIAMTAKMAPAGAAEVKRDFVYKID